MVLVSGEMEIKLFVSLTFLVLGKVHDFNSSVWRLRQDGASWGQGQPGLHNAALSQNKAMKQSVRGVLFPLSTFLFCYSLVNS